MHRIWFHARVFLIRSTPTHDNTLQVILKISIFWFADPTAAIFYFILFLFVLTTKGKENAKGKSL